MNDERLDPLWYSAEFPDQYEAPGTGRPQTAAVHPEMLDPTVPPWDPAEELAYLLQEARAEENARTGPHPREDRPGPVPHPREDRPGPVPHPREEAPVTAPAAGSPMGNLQEITAELPPLRGSRRGHRKLTTRKRLDALRLASYIIAAMAAVIVSMVSVFSGVVTYEPLLMVTTPHSSASPWWPLLVYGPWLAGSLSILRAALHRRRALHSWFVVLLFSSVAVMLCVIQAPRTIADTAAAALPGVAALACFQQLVRQITLTRPPRRRAPRHRLRPYRREVPETGPLTAVRAGSPGADGRRTRLPTESTAPLRPRVRGRPRYSTSMPKSRTSCSRPPV